MNSQSSYPEPMTLKDVDDSDVIKPPYPFPVSTIGPGQSITLATNTGPMTEL